MSTLRQFLRFFLVGTSGTVVYAVLYLALRRFAADTGALVIAWLVSTILTNIVHRLVTFGVRKKEGQLVDAVVFLLTAVIGLGISRGLMLLPIGSGPVIEVVHLVVGTGAGGVVRYLLMRWWTAEERNPATSETMVVADRS